MTGRDGEGLSFHILLKSTHIWPIHKCNTIHSNYYIDPPLKSSTMARMLLEPWQEKLPVLLHTICTMECSMMVLKIHPLHPNIMELICEGCLCSKREYLSFGLAELVWILNTQALMLFFPPPGSSHLVAERWDDDLD